MSRVYFFVFFLLLGLCPPSYSQESDDPNTKIIQIWQMFVRQNSDAQQPNTDGLEIIRTELLNAGTHSHQYLTFAATREAERQATKGNIALAFNLLDFAIEVSGDFYPEPYFVSAKFFIKYKHDFLSYLSRTVDGIMPYFNNILYLTEATGNIIIVVLLSIAFSSLIFIFIMFIKYITAILHDFGDLFPGFVPRFSTSILALLLLVAPLIFNAGAIVIILWWILILGGYATVKEKTILVVPLFVFLVSPLLLNFFGSFIVSASNLGLREMELLRTGYWDKNIIKDIEKLVEKEPLNRNLKYSLAYVYKKAGRYTESIEIYNLLLAKDNRNSDILNNLGVQLIAQKKIDEAEKIFRKGIEISPGSGEIHYNLAQILLFRDPLGTEGENELNMAKDASPEKISYYTKIFDPNNINRSAMDIPLSKWTLLGEFFSYSTEKSELFVPAFTAATKISSVWMVAVLCIIGIAGLIILHFVRLKYNLFSGYCVRCGRVACRRCNLDKDNARYCNKCESIYITKIVTDQKQIMQIEKRGAFLRSTRNSILRFLNLILPGSGAIYKNATISGALILAGISAVAIKIALKSGIISYNLDIQLIPLFWKNIVMGCMIGVLFLAAQILYRRNK